MKKWIFLLSFLCSLSSLAGEGFTPNSDPRVVMLKGPFSGGTAFLLRTPNHGDVLVTQVHVLEVGENPILQWGNEVAPFFRLIPKENDAYQTRISLQRIWEDNDLDIAVLKMPSELSGLCKCKAFSPSSSFQPGPAKLIGYPVTARRIFTETNRVLWMWRELFGHVIERESVGRVWKDGEEYLGDMDALPGNSGGPILNERNEVIGIIHLLKTWRGEGDGYKNPSLNFVPISVVLERLEALHAK